MRAGPPLGVKRKKQIIHPNSLANLLRGPNPNSGRKKGSKNYAKFDKDVATMVLTALRKMGGEKFFETLAKDYPKAFANVAARMLPREGGDKPSSGTVINVFTNVPRPPVDNMPSEESGVAITQETADPAPVIVRRRAPENIRRRPV